WATFFRSLRRTFLPVAAAVRAFGGIGQCAPLRFWSGRPAVVSGAESLLPAGLLLTGHGALRALAGPGVGAGPLATHRQAPAVPDPLIVTDLHFPADVRGDFAAQVTFEPVVALKVVAEPDQLVLG